MRSTATACASSRRRTLRRCIEGTVWIDRESFAKVKVQAVQTRIAAPIVSNEEIHTYEVVANTEGTPIYVLTRQTARQTVLIAGRNLLLEKAARFSDFRINDASFAAAREAARQGERIMYRDTDQGLRYLVKQGDRRVVSDRSTTHAKAMAIGVLVDPSFAFPAADFRDQLPELRGRGAQRHAVCAAVWRRACCREPAATEDRRHTARRER